MSVVVVKCGNPVCRSVFGVADPDGVWETDQELAQDQGWHVDGGLVACSGECLTLARVHELVTPAALSSAYNAAWSANRRKVAQLGASIAYRISRGYRIPQSDVELAQAAVADEYEACALNRETNALAGAA